MVSSISNAQSISQLFSKLDTKSQGYLDACDFASAFGQVGSSNSTSIASDIFAAFDSDSDGKVTESEFSSTLSKLQAAFDDQFNQMRMQGKGGHAPQGMNGMPPPPPPASDTGFTKEELQSQLEEIGSNDSKRSDFISNVVNNFSAADTNGDGKVSFAEAQACNQSSSDSGNATQTAASDDSRLIQQIMHLLHAYGSSLQGSTSSSSSLSVSA